MDRNRVEVQTIHGLYDETSEAVSKNINAPKPWFCFNHTFINAQLRFEMPTADGTFSIDLCSPGDKFHTNWGDAGGIRYCSKCKKIDHIHIWNEYDPIYVVNHSVYYSTISDIRTCKICHRKILISSIGSSHPNKDASLLIAEVYRQLTNTDMSLANVSSMYFVELPVQVSLAIDTFGYNYARAEVTQILKRNLGLR